jgi:tetraacyldisaccharide 4'-kinase
MKQIFKILFLGPMALVYGLVITLRNKGYDWKLLRSSEFSVPVIALGNLTAGGTGKTPHTEKILSLIGRERRIAVLSRGYKRQTKGFRYVEADDTTATVGDEPLQIKRKFPDITVAVDASRTNGIQQLMAGVAPPEMIVLDDAFQHRKVCPSVSVLLIDYHRPLHDDFLLPLGRLRDRKNQIYRADVVIVSKCPAKFTPIEQRILSKSLNLYPYQQLFLTTFDYGAPVAVNGEQTMDDGVPSQPAATPLPTTDGCLLLTGIAHPASLVDYLKKQQQEIKAHLAFPDHRRFTRNDVRKINGMARQYPALPLFTTEKDAMRLRETPGLSDDVAKRLFYLPVTVRFLAADGEEKFKKQITKNRKS